MAKRSRQRKIQGKRPPQAQAEQAVPTAPINQKPWQIAVVCAVLVLVTVFIYRGARTSEFLTYDDLGYVQDNQRVHQGLNEKSIEWAFTSFDVSNWHPLTWISHMVDWQLYGANPSGHHMTHVYLHSASAVLLFLLLLYMTGYFWRAAFVAFLFALHPAHVESVAWVSERKDVLCTFFWFATILAYAWYARKPSSKRYLWVLLGCACALMSKPMAVTLPFTLLLLDYWPLRRISFAQEAPQRWTASLFKLTLEKLPLFILAAISSVLTFIAQRAGGAMAALEAVPLWERISNAVISYCRYVRIMFWPDPLTAYYFHEKNNINVPAAVLSTIAIVLATAVCWHFRKEKPYCLFGWLWFLGTLAPVIGIVQVGDQALAERYTYVPYIGLFIILVWLAADTVAKLTKLKVPALVLAFAIIVAFAVKTDAQVKVWKNSETLFKHVIAVDPRGGLPYLGLGMAYGREGRNAEANENFDRALDYNLSGPLALSYSAYYLMQTHEQRYLPLAGQRLEKALSVYPDYYYALTYMAQWCAMMGRPKDEETYSRRVLAEHPDSVEARLYLADALQAQGQFDEAIQENRRVLAIEPNSYEAHNNLGTVFGKQGRTAEALKELRLSLSIKPDQATAHSQMGRILTQAHRLPEAIEEFIKALKYDLAKADAHNDLGVAYFQLGDYEKSAEQFSEAVKIDPASVYAQQNLAMAQAQLNNKRVHNAEK
ncbi:MAG: tetratricopeptide repeat protein [Terracidiphilus sp.]